VSVDAVALAAEQSIIAANNPKSSINLLNSFSFTKASPYSISRRLELKDLLSA